MNSPSSLCLLLGLTAFTTGITAGPVSAQTELSKLLAADGVAYDYFGRSVAFSGNRVLIGASGDGDFGYSSGSAYVFDAGTGSEIAKLTPTDGAANDYFGYSVALSGNLALVGASLDDDMGLNSGSAYLFEADTGVQVAKLTAASGGDFGYSVALSGNIALIGAPYDDDNGASSGSAYLFDVATGTQLAKLVPDDGEAGDKFGSSVAVFGEMALVGSPYDKYGSSSTGSTYLFHAFTGEQIKRIIPTDGSAYVRFGRSVALSETQALIGASESGYLFDLATGAQVARLASRGHSVALSGNMALLGGHSSGIGSNNSGSVSFFDATTGERTAQFTSSDVAPGFGRSVALEGNVAIVGAYQDDDLGTYAGSAILYDISRVGQPLELGLTAAHHFTFPTIRGSSYLLQDSSDMETWTNTGQDLAGTGNEGELCTSAAQPVENHRVIEATSQRRKLRSSTEVIGDRFGSSVAILGNLVVVGAYRDNVNGSDSGSVYCFDANTGEETAKISASDGSAGDFFGRSIALSDARILVGASYHDDNGPNSGSAYLFNTSTGEQVAKLTPDDGQGGAYFGNSAALHGSAALVGAYRDVDNGTASGSVYVFDAASGEQISKLTPEDGATDDHFGRSVALFGSTAVVGAPWDDDNGLSSGSVYLFDISTGEQTAKLIPADGASGDNFGTSVAIGGDIVVVGASGDDDHGLNSGSAYLFVASTGEQITKFAPTDIESGSSFGSVMALSGNLALFGVSSDDDNGPTSGSAYLFDATTGEQIVKITPSDGMASERFGTAVAVSGSSVIVGATGNTRSHATPGSAYIFDYLESSSEQVIESNVTRAHLLDFHTIKGNTYRLQCSDDLALWTNTALSVSGTGSGQSFCVSATKPEEFYRITTSP